MCNCPCGSYKVERRSILKLISFTSLSYLFFPLGSVFSKNKPYDGPIYDAHAHVGGKKNLNKVFKQYKKHNIKKAMFFINIKDAAEIKNKVGSNYYLCSDAYRVKKSKYRFRDNRFSVLKYHMNSSTVTGIGEFYSLLTNHPRYSAITTDLESSDFKKYLSFLNTKKAIFHIHDEKMNDKRQSIFSLYPNVKFVLAHCGYKSPEALEKILSKHKNVWTDLSLMTNRHFGPSKRWGGPKIATNPSKQWKEILVKYSNRFLVGSDVSRYTHTEFSRVIKDYRKMLGNLPQEVAENIAYKNFEKIIT